MASIRKITVEITQKSYDIIRRRVESSGHKTSRVLSRYLYTFFVMLSEGEESFYRMFSKAEACRLATVLDVIRRADEICWEELCTFSGARLSALFQLYAPEETLIMSKISTLGTLEILALMEYARTIDVPELFLRQNSKFRF